MSRSFGATSLTTRSPIRSSPALTASRPAAIRSDVVLPQPDGPTSTIRDPSSTLRFRSETATVPSSNTFVTPSNTISATTSPPVDHDRRVLEPDHRHVVATRARKQQHDRLRRLVLRDRRAVPHRRVHDDAGAGGHPEPPEGVERWRPVRLLGMIGRREVYEAPAAHRHDRLLRAEVSLRPIEPRRRRRLEVEVPDAPSTSVVFELDRLGPPAPAGAGRVVRT